MEKVKESTDYKGVLMVLNKLLLSLHDEAKKPAMRFLFISIFIYEVLISYLTHIKWLLVLLQTFDVFIVLQFE